mgnify:CR=1 FL=1
MLEVDKKTFEDEVLKAEGYVFVDFFGDGCVPCQALMPHIHAMEGDYGDKIKFTSLNTTKARRLAIRCALSAKVAAGEMVVVDGLAFDAPKTKNVVAMLAAFDAADKKALIITNGENENVELSSRNMPKVTALSNGCLNCFDLLNNNKVFLAKDAIARIEEVLA